ncbi:hypothetical protein [Saccharopolyspora shandongensis]|uniref:hypothetical protein n=1 Tax=Saccharopolyspora shandongensis TaxID=418495 RepID=UPI003403BC78
MAMSYAEARDIIRTARMMKKRTDNPNFINAYNQRIEIAKGAIERITGRDYEEVEDEERE